MVDEGVAKVFEGRSSRRWGETRGIAGRVGRSVVMEPVQFGGDS